MDASSKGFEI